MTAPIRDSVSRCHAKRDGSFWVLTLKGHCATSAEKLEEGISVTIQDGVAYPVGHVRA